MKAETPSWWWLSHTEPMWRCKEGESSMFIAGKFLFQITRGCFSRTSSDYEYCILAMGKADLLTLNDIKKLFNIK
jgi:hypothetical protein